jgi:hypothetical protein
MKTLSQIFVLALIAAFSFGCGPALAPPNSNATETPAPTVEVKKKSFDDDLASVKYNDYTWILVLRRKDSGAFDADDGKALRAYTPPDANQRLMSDDGKALIVGSNFRFYPGQWAALNKRFDVQDLSKEKYAPNENDLPSANNAANNSAGNSGNQNKPANAISNNKKP